MFICKTKNAGKFPGSLKLALPMSNCGPIVTK